jgi:CBS-domain-containing membrane protein
MEIACAGRPTNRASRVLPSWQGEKNMDAADVMTRDIVTIGPDATVAEAAQLMAKYDVSALPVVDAHNHLAGIVSEADLMQREEIGTPADHPWWTEAMIPAAMRAAEFAKSHGKRVNEVMSREVITATEDTPLARIAGILERHRIKRVPIVRDHEVVGIVSRANLIQALAASAVAPAGGLDGDRRIRQELLSRLQEQSWTDFGSRNVVVTGGKVHLWGLVGSPAERQALVVIAESVPGVAGVIDEMIPAY